MAAALGAVLALIVGPNAAKAFRLPEVEDKQKQENTCKAFAAGVLAATMAAMEKHGSEDAVLATACGVL